METKWFAIMICVFCLSFFGGMFLEKNSDNQIKVEQEKTHQLQLQLDLEKAKK
jgi:hypothetical protein